MLKIQLLGFSRCTHGELGIWLSSGLQLSYAVAAPMIKETTVGSWPQQRRATPVSGWYLKSSQVASSKIKNSIREILTLHSSDIFGEILFFHMTSWSPTVLIIKVPGFYFHYSTWGAALLDDWQSHWAGGSIRLIWFLMMSVSGTDVSAVEICWNDRWSTKWNSGYLIYQTQTTIWRGKWGKKLGMMHFTNFHYFPTKGGTI